MMRRLLAMVPPTARALCISGCVLAVGVLLLPQARGMS
jgi:hypothetical protein